jgi:hypothetical protein
MILEIFDVEHGACALLTADNGTHLMIDCADNPITGWSPGTHLRRANIPTLDMLAITNYDEDHVRGAIDLFRNVHVNWLWRNKSVSGAILRSLKSDDGMGRGIETLAFKMEYEFTFDATPQAPEPAFLGLDKSAFCNSYPAFDDENNLSMVIFLRATASVSCSPEICTRRDCYDF